MKIIEYYQVQIVYLNLYKDYLLTILMMYSFELI